MIEAVGATRLLAGCGLAFLQAEGNEAMGRVVGRKTDRDPIARDHANSETTHPTRELSRNLLAALECNLIAATAENLVDATGRLYQVVSCQIESILPTIVIAGSRMGVSPTGLALGFCLSAWAFIAPSALAFAMTTTRATPFEERAG